MVVVENLSCWACKAMIPWSFYQGYSSEPHMQEIIYLIFFKESITSLVSKLDVKIQFSAKTCGIHWTGVTTWLKCTYTVQNVSVYELLRRASVAWGPLSATKQERQFVWPFFCGKILRIFFFSQKALPWVLNYYFRMSPWSGSVYE